MIAIRPAYRRNRFVGYCLFTCEPVGVVFRSYSRAAAALKEFR